MDGWEICLSTNWLSLLTTHLFYWILCFGVEHSVSLVSSHVHNFCLWMHALHVIERESSEWNTVSCTSDYYWNRNVVGPGFISIIIVEVYFIVERACFYSGVGTHNMATSNPRPCKCIYDMCGELIDIIGSNTKCSIIGNLISQYVCFLNTWLKLKFKW